MIAADLRGDDKPSLNEALGWIGSRVDDIYGAVAGRLEDVWVDPGTGDPRWLLVREGRFGGATLIPFEDATAGADHVWVPYEREIVAEAPAIEPGAPLTHQIEAALRNHFAANVPAGTSDRGGSPVPLPQPDSAAATATIRLRGPAEAGPPAAFGVDSPGLQRSGEPPQPRRQVRREPPPSDFGGQLQQAPVPPARLPARPAPPVAAPNPQRGVGDAPAPDWPGSPQRPTTPPRFPPSPPGPAPSPAAGIEALQAIAASPDIHYVEIELSGELTIRGELRSVRIERRSGPSERTADPA